jgi:hypothetical protein
MKKSLLAGVLALGMVSFLTLSAGGQGKKAPQPPGIAGDFKGKVLVVYTRSQPPGAVLEKAAIRELAQRFFLVGKAPEDKNRWSGSTIWLSMEEVTMIAVFDTLEDARKITDNR